MTFLTTKTARCCYGTGSQRSHRCCRVFFRVRYRPSYGNGLTAADSHGAPCCPASRDADKFHHHRPPPDPAIYSTLYARGQPTFHHYRPQPDPAIYSALYARGQPTFHHHRPPPDPAIYSALCARGQPTFHHHRPPPDLACEYTVLPQEMSSSSYGRCAALGRRAGDDDDDGGAGGWYGCSCRRLGTAPRPSDPIAYLSGTVDRQPGSWTDDEVDDEAHRHCTCTSGRSWTVPRDRPGKTSPK